MVKESGVKLPGVTGILDIIAKHPLLPWTAKVVSEYMRKKIQQMILHPKFKCTDKFLDLLVRRAKKQARFTKETAAREGSLAHKLFDDFISGKMPEKDEMVFRSFRRWMEEEPLKIVKGDTKVASLLFKYGGSLDCFLEDKDGRLVVGDFKTGKSMYDSHAFQVAAYSYAAKETFGLNYYPNGVIIRFSKKKPYFQRKNVIDIHKSFECFISALDLYYGHRYEHLENSEKIKAEENINVPT